MTEFKESSKTKKIHRNIDSFFRELSKNEEQRMVKPQEVNQTVNLKKKIDLKASFEQPSHDQSSRQEKNINDQYLMNLYYENKSQNVPDKSMINSTMLQNSRSQNKNHLNNSGENNYQHYPIVESKPYEKFLKDSYFEDQKSRNYKKKKQQLKQVNKQQKFNNEAQRQYKKKIPQNFNPPKNQFQDEAYFKNKQEDIEMSQIVHKYECSQIETQQFEPFFPEIKNLKKTLTPEQLKAVICDTIREEMKRAKNPLLPSQEKFKLQERHRDLANNLNKNRIVFNQNIIQGGRKSRSNRKYPLYDEFSFGDDQQMLQNYHQNQLRSSKPTSQKLFQQAMNLKDSDSKSFKQFSQKFKANSKTQKDKKSYHNAKVIFGTIATISGIGIKVATDVQKHYRQTSTSIQSNIMSCGKAMVGGAVGKMLADKINPKLRNYGALLGVLATSQQAKSRMAKVLSKTSQYLHRFDGMNQKTDDTNKQNLQDIILQQEFIYEQNQKIRKN